MQIVKNWLYDMPQQFRGKENIEILVKAFANQLEELANVFSDIQSKTNLDTAVGNNLDAIGNILSTTRVEAGEVLKLSKETEVTDERYRNVLKWKALCNSMDCTYEDVMHAVDIIWGTDALTYVESDEYPASFFLQFEDADVSVIDPTLGAVLLVKPAGVTANYSINYKMGADESIEAFTVEKMICAKYWYLNGTYYLDGQNTFTDVEWEEKING